MPKGYPNNPKPPEFYFWQKVDKRGPDECWPWLGYCHPGGGYGMFWDRKRRRMVNAHRFSYELANDVCLFKPKGVFGAVDIVICHSCDNPPCVNPAHLRADSQSANVKEAVEKGRWTAKRGEANGNTRFPPETIAAILAEHAGPGVYGENMRLERKYGVSNSYISHLVRGRFREDARS